MVLFCFLLAVKTYSCISMWLCAYPTHQMPSFSASCTEVPGILLVCCACFLFYRVKLGLALRLVILRLTQDHSHFVPQCLMVTKMLRITFVRNTVDSVPF